MELESISTTANNTSQNGVGKKFLIISISLTVILNLSVAIWFFIYLQQNGLDKFKVLFRAVGVGIGKLIFPVLAAIDFIRGIVDSLKTSTFTSPIAKAIDALLTGVGFAVGGFIGGLVDLIKDGISWLTEKLRFTF